MSDPATPEETLPDFSGKVVVFYLSGAPRGVEHGVVLEYPEFRRFGGSLFVVGRGPAWSGREWNLPSGVAWAAVVNYLAFPSRTEFEQRMAQGSRGFLAKLFSR